MTLRPEFYRDFDYDRSLLPNRFVAQLEEQTHDIESARDHSGATIGYPGWNLLYYAILACLKPEEENILIETGTNLGFSTIFMAQALIDRKRQGIVHTIELEPENYQKAQQNFKAAGVAERINCYQGDSLKLLPEVIAPLESIRFAFLDGCHTREHVVEEFRLIHPKLEPGAIVFFDNIGNIGQAKNDQRVFGALKDISKLFGGNLIRFPFTSWFTPGQAMWQA